MIFAPPFSSLFWVCYLGAGASDIADGIAARALNQASDFGAKLDSAADFIFACALAAIIIVNIAIPVWLWACIAGIAALRFTAYGIGFFKYRAFSALHTYANKAAGAAIFLFPLLYTAFGLKTSGVTLCVIAFLSALEEVLITIQSNSLDRDCKSIFLK